LNNLHHDIIPKKPTPAKGEGGNGKEEEKIRIACCIFHDVTGYEEDVYTHLLLLLPLLPLPLNI